MRVPRGDGTKIFADHQGFRLPRCVWNNSRSQYFRPAAKWVAHDVDLASSRHLAGAGGGTIGGQPATCSDACARYPLLVVNHRNDLDANALPFIAISLDISRFGSQFPGSIHDRRQDTNPIKPFQVSDICSGRPLITKCRKVGVGYQSMILLPQR